MALRTTVPFEEPLEETDEYYCPVCGIGLSLSSFELPERDYYCPYCATRQTPAAL